MIMWTGYSWFPSITSKKYDYRMLVSLVDEHFCIKEDYPGAFEYAWKSSIANERKHTSEFYPEVTETSVLMTGILIYRAFYLGHSNQQEQQ